MKSFPTNFVNNNLDTLIIQTNSPGELSRFVRPIVKAFCTQASQPQIIIFIAPCQYASGQEVTIAKAIPGVDAVYGPKAFLSFLFGFPLQYPSKHTRILYLGGDPMYSRLLAWKVRGSVYAYTEHAHFSKKGFEQVFYQSEGDLMASSFKGLHFERTALLKRYNLANKPIVLFFAGSRWPHFNALFPFFVDCISQTDFQHYQPVLLVSPFISDDRLDEQINALGTPASFPIIRGDSRELLSLSSLLVTIPGTNTAEAMYMGVPMLVLMPLNRPDLIIFDGLLGLLGRLPILGTLLKRLALMILKRTTGFLAKPNQYFNEEVVPECRGILTETLVSETIQSLLQDEAQLQQIKTRLESINPDYDVATRIVSQLLND